MKTRIAASSCLLCILFLLSTLRAGSADRPMRISAATALANSLDIMGRDLLKSWQQPEGRESVYLDTISDTTTPFMTYQDKGAFRVEMAKVPVAIRRMISSGDTATYTDSRDFEVYIGSESGVLMKVVSTLPSYYDKISNGEIRIPPVKEAEKQLQRSPKGYTFATENPAASFLEVIGVLPSNPLMADRICGVVATITNMQGNRQTVWIVDTYGVESITTGHFRKEPYQLNHIRSIVDGETGKLVSWSNSPCVVEPDGQ